MGLFRVHHDKIIGLQNISQQRLVEKGLHLAVQFFKIIKKIFTTLTGCVMREE